MSLPMSQYKAANLVGRVLISLLLFPFYSEATLSPSLAPYSRPLISAPPPYSQHRSNPAIPPPFFSETTPPPHSQHHSHPLIPAPNTVALPYHLLPPTGLPYPYPYPRHHHHTPPPTNGGVGVIPPSSSPQAQRPHHHHHHDKHQSSSPSSAVPLPSPYSSPPFGFNSPPPPPRAYPFIPRIPTAHPPAVAPSNHPFKSTPPASPPPPQRYDEWDPLPPNN